MREPARQHATKIKVSWASQQVRRLAAARCKKERASSRNCIALVTRPSTCAPINLGALIRRQGRQVVCCRVALSLHCRCISALSCPSQLARQDTGAAQQSSASGQQVAARAGWARGRLAGGAQIASRRADTPDRAGRIPDAPGYETSHCRWGARWRNRRPVSPGARPPGAGSRARLVGARQSRAPAAGALCRPARAGRPL